MRYLAIPLVALALSGCAAIKELAPATVEAFNAGGALTAARVTAGGLAAKCLLPTGEELLVEQEASAKKLSDRTLAETVDLKIRELCDRIGAEPITEFTEGEG